jgi:hypothetical protein
MFCFLGGKSETNAGCRPIGNQVNFPGDEELEEQGMDIYATT